MILNACLKKWQKYLKGIILNIFLIEIAGGFIRSANGEGQFL